MRARRVKRLEPDAPLAENALRMAMVRIDEVWTFAEAAGDRADRKALHDMRIAAKRLRYLLELVEPCLGEPASRGAKQAKQIQTLLGEIHDCDELIPLVRGHVKRMRSEDVRAVLSAAEGARDVEPAAARAAPNRARYRGLASLRAYLAARRETLFVSFLEEWAKLERNRFRERLEEDLASASETAARAARAQMRAARARAQIDDGHAAGAPTMTT